MAGLSNGVAERAATAWPLFFEELQGSENGVIGGVVELIEPVINEGCIYLPLRHILQGIIQE